MSHDQILMWVVNPVQVVIMKLQSLKNRFSKSSFYNPKNSNLDFFLNKLI